MTPKALLAQNVENEIVGPLESTGFRYNRRAFTLTRVRGDFTDEVSFTISNSSEVDDCQFTTAWAVKSAEFVKWHEQRWGAGSAERLVVITNDWLIRGWPRSSGFRLLNDKARDAGEMHELLEAMKLVGIPFLNSISSLEAAAEFWLERDLRTDLCCALLVKTNQADRAHRLLQSTILEVERRNLQSRHFVVPQLMELKERYLGQGAL
jgi:hypothetical protein